MIASHRRTVEQESHVAHDLPLHAGMNYSLGGQPLS